MHRHQRRHHSHNSRPSSDPPRNEEHYHHYHDTEEQCYVKHQSDDSILHDRVHRVSKTIADLRFKLAMERDLLQKEKNLARSLHLSTTTSEYHAEVDEYPQEYEKRCVNPRQNYDLETIYNYDLPAVSQSQESISADQAFVDKGRKNVLLTQVQAYKQHLKSVENKCKIELGAVEESINTLKRVSTELHLEMAANRRYTDGEKVYVMRQQHFYEIVD